MESEPAPRTETLPSRLLAELSATERDALGHRLRRQILRALNASVEPRSASEIRAAVLPQVSLSAIGYHTRVLEACGSVVLSGARPARTGINRLYVSKLAGNERVDAVLQATRSRDRWGGDPQ